jgi:predicted nucleic acid-binding protein
MAEYLIDSSVWIPTLRNDGPKSLKLRVRDWVMENRVAITSIVKVELISGAANDQDLEFLQDQLRGLSSILLSEDQFEEAGRTGFELRKQGITVPAADLIIAMAASVGGLTLVHADKHFEVIRTVLPIKSLSFLDEISAWRKVRTRRK